jgi:hypothetical protein
MDRLRRELEWAVRQGERIFLGTLPQPTTNPVTLVSDDPRIRYIDFYDLGTWNSYIPLQQGEQVQFGDLLRGMMYPSGNDAAIADRRARRWQCQHLR